MKSLVGSSALFLSLALSSNAIGLNVRLTSEQTIARLQHRIAKLEDENVELLREVERLRRQVYLKEVRKDSCPLGGFLGSDDGPWEASAAGYDKRWAGCYPEKLKARYCMSNEATDYGQMVDGNCQSSAG